MPAFGFDRFHFTVESINATNNRSPVRNCCACHSKGMITHLYRNKSGSKCNTVLCFSEQVAQVFLGKIGNSSLL